MFSIHFDQERSLVRVKMSGFLEVEDFTESSRQEQAGVVQMGCRSGEFVLLIDTKDAVIQSQAVLSAFMDGITNGCLKAGRIAVVGSDILTRMQIQPILMIRDNAAMFSTSAEAEAWLLGDASQNDEAGSTAAMIGSPVLQPTAISI